MFLRILNNNYRFFNIKNFQLTSNIKKLLEKNPIVAAETEIEMLGNEMFCLHWFIIKLSELI